jgi:hypothetical protein
MRRELDVFAGDSLGGVPRFASGGWVSWGEVAEGEILLFELLAVFLRVFFHDPPPLR